MNDDFDREVYCIGGLPFDAISQQQAITQLYAVIDQNERCFLSTPNLDFLMASKTDKQFRESVINSDLSVADGMPIVWLAKLMKIPIRERIAGSTLFDELGNADGQGGSLSIFFFGGNPGVAEQACAKTKSGYPNFHCAGFIDPGFVSVDEMSRPEYFEAINNSGADFLVIALGSKKGQAWIEKNYQHLSVPVVSHLGAVINFVASTVKRAPLIMQKTGFEWLWRIKEEPGLWKRYWNNAIGLAVILFREALPYYFYVKKNQKNIQEPGAILMTDSEDFVRISLSGMFQANDNSRLKDTFRQAIALGKDINIDFKTVSYLDSGILGTLIMLRKNLNKLGKELIFKDITAKVRPVFRWCNAEYLLT